MNLAEAQRILALRAVLRPKSDPEYQIRKIFRWYSTTFHTPLHLVPELPLDEVFEAYFEVHFEDLRSKYEEKNDPKILDELDDVLLTPEERAKRVAAEEAEEMERDAFADRVAAEEAAKALRNVQDKVGHALRALDGKTPPNMTMQFMGKEEFERALEQPAFSLFGDAGAIPSPAAPPDISLDFADFDGPGGIAPPPKKRNLKGK